MTQTMGAADMHIHSSSACRLPCICGHFDVRSRVT
jgi:hypothetical protein